MCNRAWSISMRQACTMNQHVPFGGIKNSGFGREGTETDLELMTEWKWITVQLPGTAAH